MAKYSARSLARLHECDERLQLIFGELIHRMDVTILCGHRGEKDQNDAFARGNSKLKWPRSKHNKLPSLAVDAAPWPIDWKDIARFEVMRSHIKDIARELGIKIRHISWDKPHTELV